MRALVVEDFVPLQSAIAEALRHDGWAVDATSDGKEGLWYAQREPYDTVVLDLMLPGLPGLDVLKKLRAGGCEAPVLILTARSDVADRIAGLDGGADDYLVKPFDMDELLARVRCISRRRSPSRNPTICVADLTVDAARRNAHRAGREIKLTRREYGLLLHLAQHAETVVSREEIWSSVYEFHDEGTSNVIDVYVGYLRKKLEAGGEPRLLHTHRGHGYRLGSSA